MICRLQVGLGTDVAGGHSCSMLDAIRMTMVATSVCGMQADEDGVVWQPLRCVHVYRNQVLVKRLFLAAVVLLLLVVVVVLAVVCVVSVKFIC